MAKDKTKETAKALQKVRAAKAKEKAAEQILDENAGVETPAVDAETRKMRLKALIKLGKERSYLTYAEINDHLPDDVVDAEQIESIISTFSDMGIKVFDEAPAAEDLLMSDNAPAVALYLKHGFAVIAERRDYYAPGSDALVLELSLKEEVR